MATPRKIVDIFSDQPNTSVVGVVGVYGKVHLGLLRDDPPLRATGHWELIHVGFAMSKVSEEDVLDRMRVLSMFGEPEAAMQEVKGTAWKTVMKFLTTSANPKILRDDLKSAMRSREPENDDEQEIQKQRKTKIKAGQQHSTIGEQRSTEDRQK